jgi:CRP/FNR family cyclic AMP-dependent transcriptional regulator
MDINLIQALGYGGTTATIASYAMKDILALRIAAVTSSFFFIAYSASLGLWPLFLTEIVILPINGFRLLQLVRERRMATARLLAGG